MKHWMTALLIIALALTAAGCAQMTGDKSADTAQPTAEQTGSPLLGNAMLQGLQAQNYGHFSQNFAPDLRQSTPEAAFRKLCADLDQKNDQIVSFKHLDTLERGGIYRTELWKVTVERRVKHNTSLIDRVFYVSTAAINGKAAVIGYKFETLF